MKKSLMLAGALVMSVFTFAQNDEDNRSDHHRHRGDRGETMKTVLMLDDKQVQSIKEIDQKYEEKHKGIRKDSTMKRDDRFKAHQELRNQRQADIGKVLTKEQSTKWAAYKKERKEKRHAEHEKRSGEHGRGRKGGGGHHRKGGRF